MTHVGILLARGAVCYTPNDSSMLHKPFSFEEVAVNSVTPI